MPLGSICNYSKQCSAIDSNSICEFNKNDVKVCQCNSDSYLFSEYKTDYIKICKIKQKTTVRTTTEEDLQDITIVSTENGNIANGNTEEALYANSNSSNYITNSSNDKTGNVGIVLFLVAILLAVLIVVIIIRYSFIHSFIELITFS